MLFKKQWTRKEREVHENQQEGKTSSNSSSSGIVSQYVLKPAFRCPLATVHRVPRTEIHSNTSPRPHRIVVLLDERWSFATTLGRFGSSVGFSGEDARARRQVHLTTYARTKSVVERSWMRKLCTLSLLFLNDDGAVRCGGDARFVHGFGRANSSALFVRHFYGVCSDLGGRLRRTRLIPSSLVNIHTPACRRVAKCANFNVLIVFRFGKKLPLTIQVWGNQFIVLLSSGSRSFTTCVERTLKNHEEVVQNAECAVIYVYTTNP